MLYIILVNLILPFFVFGLFHFFPKTKEKRITKLTLATLILSFILNLAIVIIWFVGPDKYLYYKLLTIYEHDQFEFALTYFFDKKTVVFALLGPIITFLVARFSQFYMHRDPGFKRFFCFLLLFYFGYNVVIFSGNFDTLFIGWEFLGICSFVLISFYQDRYLPAKNALKVISIFRVGDVSLMLLIWLSHHIFGKSVNFSEFQSLDLTNISTIATTFIFGFIVFSATIKSAAFPFSSWLPRAMEGPTVSSAVFYGSLSVHLGAFLLLRTYDFWNNSTEIVILIIAIGIASALAGTFIGRVQSTVKTQIAYASVAQIGLIFIEIALGWHILAMVHIAGNAFLRTYQLLISPSVLSYKIHDMLFHFEAKENPKMSNLQKAMYILGVKEFNMDSFQYRFMWNPFKNMGKKLEIFESKIGVLFLGIILIFSLLYIKLEENIPDTLDYFATLTIAFIGFLLIVRAFTSRNMATLVWLQIIVGQCFIYLSITINEAFEIHQIGLYLSGVTIAGAIGYWILATVKTKESDIKLDKFHGLAYDYELKSILFLVCCLGILGFPFTPTFLGIDLIFNHIQANQIALIVFVSISFVLVEIAALRLYARLFLGPNKRNDHPIAFRSS